ncbi:MAG: tRNA (5-methylaminomethyl-2-thiouridine)(34)-methyltransferase MnmD [Pseudomonadales bacterium]|nr:tRNA (5-methylaminomethyl-2-thiouridine)(34)-methyltransferase MnmD [Pseudomonadales bacterium]MBO7004715.1 tRNA (5-methylaminomethyl-2-thiouridine)(34)-methyltransferase MnmD [Pseudomonadales bacterium]
MSTYLVDTAQIEWQEENPVSKVYGDIYWHRGSPLDEKAQVFLEPLLTLVQQPPERSQVTVCELGFGFGMNCLLTAQAWQQRPSSCQLNFVSIEKHPVDKVALEKFLKGLKFPHTERLLAGYPPPYRGQHIVWLAPNIRLLLIFEEVETALGNLDAEVDCWYLDGFAPAKNEAMWQAPLFRKMFARSRPGAQVATYSAAGNVRRGLERSGFETAKRPGFGQKREMLTAAKPGAWSPKAHGRESVSIIGAGIAGLFCYEALSRRGLSAELYDSGKAGPSAIPQLTVLPQLARAAETRYRFSVAASQYMRDAAGYHESGLHWIGRTEEETVRLKEISELFPDNLIEARSDGAFYRNAGWLSFSELRDELSPAIIQRHIDRLDDLSSDQVILATGFNRSLLPAQLQVRAIRGQAIEVRTSGIQHVVNSQATIFPTVNGKSVISGTYENIDSDVVREEETKELINTARKYVELDDSIVTPWTGIRAVSRDRLPVIGQAPDWQAAKEVNRVSAIREFQPGLHYCTAFASRGATHARLCAEHVVSKLLGEPAALGLEEQQLLSPARFVIRDRLL